MTQDLKLASKLYGDFQTSLDKRSAFFLFYKVLPVVLDWHLKTWQKEMEFLDPKDESKREAWSEYYQLLTISVGILDSIHKKALLEKGNNIYGFFDKFVKHVEKFKDIKITVNNIDRYYAEEILINFYRTFFAEITNAPDNFTIWEYFPSQWKITLAGIKENIIQRITFKQFIDLAKNKLWSEATNKYDYTLDELSENLFPEASPQAWANILVFVLRAWINDERIKGFVEAKLNFGLTGRAQVFWGKMSGDELSNMMTASEDQQVTSAIELALVVFRNQFTLQSVTRDLEQLKKLSYAENSREELRRQYLIKLWENIKGHLEKARVAAVGSQT